MSIFTNTDSLEALLEAVNGLSGGGSGGGSVETCTVSTTMGIFASVLCYSDGTTVHGDDPTLLAGMNKSITVAKNSVLAISGEDPLWTVEGDADIISDGITLVLAVYGDCVIENGFAPG